MMKRYEIVSACDLGYLLPHFIGVNFLLEGHHFVDLQPKLAYITRYLAGNFL